MNTLTIWQVLAKGALRLTPVALPAGLFAGHLVSSVNQAQAQTPNLAPYQPQGWSDALVVSSSPGSHAASTVFYDDQDIYIDWACYNSTANNASGQFMVKLYVDGTNKANWNINGLNGNTYTSYSDYKAAKLPAGTHVVRFDIDTGSVIAESNESDNSISKSIAVEPRIAPLEIVTTSPLASAIVGIAYTNTLAAAGGTPPYGWLVTSSNLPPPLTLNPTNGLLSGTPASQSNLTFTVKVTDASNAVDSMQFSLDILPAAADPNLIVLHQTGWGDRLVIATSQNQTADADDIYNDQDVYLNWIVKNEVSTAIAGAFDVKLFIDSQLKQSWTHGSLAGFGILAETNYNIGKLTPGNHVFRIELDTLGAVKESNEGDNLFEKTFAILQRPNPPAITAQNPLPTGMKGLDYSYFMKAEGGVGPYAWSLSDGVLPNGVILDPVTGEIRGAPTEEGSFPVKIKVAGANGFFSESAFDLQINPTSPLPNLQFYTLPTWSNSVLVSLTADAVMDSTNIYDDQDVFISWAVVNRSPSVNVNQKVSCRLYVDDVRVQEWQFAGLNASSEMHLAGYNMGPLTTGDRTVKMVIDPLNSIVEFDETDNTVVKTVHVLHNPTPLTILSDGVLPDATNAYPYSFVIAAANGVGARSWSILSGYLPPGLAFDTNSGAIQGTPSVAGYFPFKVQVKTTDGKHSEKEFELSVALTPDRANLAVYTPYGWSSPLVINTTNGSRQEMETAYDDEDLYISWAVLNESYTMPVATPFRIKLYLDDALVREWTNSVALAPVTYTTAKDYKIGKLFSGQHTMRLAVDTENAIDEPDKADNSFTNAIGILARLPAPAIDSASVLPVGTNGQPYSATLVASGGAAPYTWTIVSGVLPPGLTLATNTGVISGTPAAAATYAMSLRVTGANRLFSEKSFSLDVREPLLPPLVVAQPQSQTVFEGGMASFSVTASGTAPISFQWLKDGKTIADNDRFHGTQTASLTISNAAFGDMGKYSVNLINLVKTLSSAEAELTVLHQPAGLSLEMYAGLTIIGSIGAEIEIQHTPDMTDTNHWIVLTNMVLPSSPFLFIDTNSPTASKRYYRAVTKN